MKRIYFLIMFAFFSVMTMAQEGGSGADINVDITKSGSNGGGFPWLWVVGAIVFIVLLVALLGGRGGTDRVVEKKTVIKE
jgi:hypothetical protein